MTLNPIGRYLAAFFVPEIYMLRFKPEVRLYDLVPQMYLCMYVVDRIFEKHGLDDCLINSANDSHHSNASLHYAGAAIDFDTHDGPPDNRLCKFPWDVDMDVVVRDIKASLPVGFDVVYHNTHLHIEWQPKRPK